MQASWQSATAWARAHRKPLVAFFMLMPLVTLAVLWGFLTSPALSAGIVTGEAAGLAPMLGVMALLLSGWLAWWVNHLPMPRMGMAIVALYLCAVGAALWMK